MKLFEKFLENSTTLRELLDTYLELRTHFQELKFSESDLEQPPLYTNKMMTLSKKFQSINNDLRRQVKDFGVPMTEDEFDDFIVPRLKKINELIPLKDGDNKRRNSRNKDN